MKNLNFDAVIFDLDGVITNTAETHSAAWKLMFDEFLTEHARQTHTPFREFNHQDDYLPYVDGKPRYKGVESFLQSRGIELPFGNPEDGPDTQTICGLGNNKNQIYNHMIRDGGILVYQSTVDLLHQLRALGIRIGVASSSKNARTVLKAVDLLGSVETCIDGIVSAELNLKGKPEPDIFHKACDELGVHYDRAVIVEDAVSGTQAGQNGGFGLVIGVAREDNALELKVNGADLVVEDLAEIDISRIEDWLTRGLVQEKWSISYYDYNLDHEGVREALMCVGNGYFATRGAQEETIANEYNYPGTYLAGLYNALDSEVGGRIVRNEDLVNCPNWLPVTFKIGDGEWFDPNRFKIKHITRRLDFRTGALVRNLVVVDDEGQETRIESQRLASMDNPHLAAIRYQIIPLNYDQQITVKSILDGTVENKGVSRYRELSSNHLLPVKEEITGNRCSLLVKTSHSNIYLAQAARLQVSQNGNDLKPEITSDCQPGRVTSQFSIMGQRGVAVTVDKIVAIYASHQEKIDDPLTAAQEALTNIINFETVQRSSASAWDSIWEKIDIQIEGDRTAQKLLRLHLYHTILTASPHNKELDAGLPARGLTGESYRGHIFWDELFIQPFINLHFQETAKAALMYRYNRLGQAQRYARQFGLKGAMFPWQSGREGTEETQTLHLNPISGEWGADHSTLQRHVNLAIAYNFWQYAWVTEDKKFLEDCGAELLIEICRFWASKAMLNNETNRYDILNVMGPDEFHERYPGMKDGGLKNNSYTNLMVAWLFGRANQLLESLQAKSRNALNKKLGLTEEELELWKSIRENLFIPISEDGILEQFEGYFELDELNWGQYQQQYGNIQRMDRILKAEGKSADNYKVSKQADALMIFYILEEEEVKQILSDLGYSVPETLLRDNYYYYLNRTSHGSTLSRLVHAYLAHLLGDLSLSWQMYSEALKSDYIDIQGGTTKEGIHAGVMTGTLYFALRAYAGINTNGDYLAIFPNLPITWRKMQFNIGFKGCRYHFVISPGLVEVLANCDEEQTIVVGNKKIDLKPKKWFKLNVEEG